MILDSEITITLRESTNILINLPTTIEKVLSMELTSFEFPNSYFLIGKKYNNNYFAIKFYDRLAPTVYLEEIVIIPDGNYTRSQLQNVMNQQNSSCLCFSCLVNYSRSKYR